MGNEKHRRYKPRKFNEIRVEFRKSRGMRNLLETEGRAKLGGIFEICS